MLLDFLTQEELFNGGILIMLVGLPGSGKSTLAKQLDDNYMNFKIVCPDDIREELTGNASDQSRNNEVFSKVYNRLIKYLDDGYNVIYDATNCRSAYRKKIMNVVDGHYNKTICICFTTSLNECLNNIANRDRSVPEDIIESMYITLRNHAPNPFEGYDIILRV